MTDDNVRELPVSDFDFDLDAEEREQRDVRPPFRTKVGGKVLEFGDPEEIDWQDLLLIETPVDMLQFVTSREDLRHLRDQAMPGWKLGKLLEAYQRHFGFDEKLLKAQRERAQAERTLR